MKQKKYFILAAAAILMAACSENDIAEKQSPQVAAEDGAVVFDAYMQRATTRAGVPGAVTTNDLKSTTTDLGKAGFGVFGYYTNSSTYDQQAIPNFFYNQKVAYNGSVWAYEPIKYWPNEYGSKAESDDADKVTYFAYAPYVSVNPSTGKPNETDDQDELSELQKWGINSMTTNSTMGDPLIKYIASFDQAKSVDLTWGVCDETNWQIIQTGASQTLQKGKPWLNVERPANTSQKLKFTFKHATAQLKVNIDAYVDGINNAEITAETKVYVRSVTFEGLATKGALNLNNSEAGLRPDGDSKAYWMDYNGTNDLTMGESVTVYDGRKDGKEGTPSGEATNEKSLGLNPNLIQSTIWKPTTGSAMPGVTNVPQPLFCNGSAPATEPIYVIPTGDPVKVTITYDIETADNNLATYVSDAEQHGSSIENVISKNITFSKNGTEIIKAFENGKSYTINLHLGMNSVKFDAFVTDWIPQSANDVDLPANIPSYQATGAGTPVTATVSADAISYQFAVTGLDPFETITGTADGTYGPIAADTYSATAKASGVAIMTVTLDENKTVEDIENATALELTAGTSGKKVNLTVTQKAAPLGLTVHSLSTTDNKTFELHSTADETDWSGLTPDIKVWKNGIPLKLTDDYTVTLATSAGAKICDLVLGDEVAPGDVYTFKVEAGNAPVETATARIAGIVYPTSKKLTYRKDAQGPILPTLYGPGENAADNYNWTAVSTGNILVTTDGMITTVQAETTTPVNYKATLTSSYITDATSKGWFFSLTSHEATLQLTADKQDAVGSFTAPTIAAQTYNSGGKVVCSGISSTFSFKGKLDTTENADGTISYDIDKVMKDGVVLPNATFTVTDTYLVSGPVLESGQYVVTVKATKDAGDKYNAAVITGDFKFTAN